MYQKVKHEQLHGIPLTLLSIACQHCPKKASAKGAAEQMLRWWGICDELARMGDGAMGAACR